MIRTIIVVIISLVVGFCIGVWWTTDQAFSKIEFAAETADQLEEPAQEEDTTPESETSAEETITVDATMLSDTQKSTLETFGIDTDSIEITQEMILCAEEKVGKERLEEIKNGDTPSFLEGLALTSCL